jgi:hypothetical protein
MCIEIGTYVNKENPREIGLVDAVYRSFFFKDGNLISGIGIGDEYDENYYFDLKENLGKGNQRYYMDLFSYYSFSNYKGPMKQGIGSLFPEKKFLKLYKPLKVVSNKKKIEIGKIYGDSSENKVFVLGIFKTNNKEDFHTVAVREIDSENFNKYIDYDHAQFGSTPDFYDCFFYNRGEFLKRYKLLDILDNQNKEGTFDDDDDDDDDDWDPRQNHWNREYDDDDD